MTKKKQQKSARSLLTKGFGTPDLPSKLRQLKGLMNNNQIEDVETLALRLYEEFPQSLDVTKALVDIYSYLKDFHQEIYFLQKAIEIDPNNARIYYRLGFVCFTYSHLYLCNGYQYLDHCVKQWPDYEFSENATSLLCVFDDDKALIVLQEFGLAEVTNSLEVGQRCEQVKLYSKIGKYLDCEKVLLNLIQEFPDVPDLKLYFARNLLCQNKISESIALIEETIVFYPNKVSTYCILILNTLYNNQIEKAKQLAEQLKLEYLDDFINQCDISNWINVFDVLSRLSDDLTIIRLFEAIEAWQNNEENTTLNPLQYSRILHFTATSFYHLDDKNKAQILLKKAYDLDRTSAILERNIEDLKLPPEEQNGIWVFEITDWLLPQIAVEFKQYAKLALNKSKKTDGDKLRSLFIAIVSKYPYLYWLSTYLLDRGSKNDRVFYRSMAYITQDARLMSFLKEFTLKEKGSKTLREEFLKNIEDFEETKSIPDGLLT